MYIAELKGKIPSNFEKMEDILTSNVFSFFKYSKRTIYLKALLDKLNFPNKLNIAVSDKELNEAEFIFWPTYEDGTEPDLVILVGDYYLLFEAKYFSDFGKKTLTAEYQLVREATEGLKAAELKYFSDFEKETITLKKQLVEEATEGLKAAKNIGKHFFIIAITADYFKPNKFEVIENFKEHFTWINWQTITELLLSLIEEKQESLPDLFFANDLYQLLDKKRLRAFRNFDVLAGIFTGSEIENIFFSPETTKYREDFVGFLKAFSNFPIISEAPKYLFFGSYI